jgi:pimeloyl-ACP methyl ester carboxylesterase
MSTADYGLLNNPAISMNSFYPRRNGTPTPPGAEDHAIDVAEGIQLSCRFFPAGQSASKAASEEGGTDAAPGNDKGDGAGNENPTILFFYGNGETSGDYDGIAPLYNGIGVNFFVADYRGYGGSGGEPEFNSMLSDTLKVLTRMTKIMEEVGYSGGIYVMGRSMGRHAAFEIAANSPGGVQGMIIESGRPTLGQFINGIEESAALALEQDYRAKVASISIPALVIHGEMDTLAPVGDAVSMYESLASTHKRLLTIPGAGHNDLLYVGINEYMNAIRDFVSPGSAAA